ncbi:MAG: ABC transporter substrate-binding protein [Chromatiales bacterium]|jgi:branched-chain amino acid transport system substrate-binding protein|nr:ABC transporter substrate-binding protein [Chromatiales bacterium]
MSILKTVTLALGVAALTVGQGALAKNAPGVTDTSIKIGNTNPYSGPASSYSTIGKSIGAYFKMINENGGVNGRKIDWISVDDGYSPPKTKEQFRKLIEREKVAFMFQSLGTPTNSAVHRYMNKKKVPQLFVATGATKWGDPKNFPWTMGFQPNYQTMGKIFGGYVMKNHPNGKIGILYQNDDYGKDYLVGLKAALGDKASTMIVKEETYEVTDPTIDSQIVNLKASGANIFYNVSIPKFAAQAIKKSYDIGWKPVHLLNDVSNSVASVLSPAGLDKSQGILSAAYLKDPTDSAWKDDAEFKEWQAFMAKHYPEGDATNPFNGYGYAVASLMVHVLEKCGNDLSRENIMKQAASIKDFRLKMALPGINVNTSADDFYPVEQAQMMVFKGESWERFGDLISADSL